MIQLAEQRAARAKAAEETSKAREEADSKRAAQRRAHEAAVREEDERLRAGPPAVLEQVDVVIKQKVEFKAGSTVVEDINVPALICVADLMMSEPQIKVGVQAAPGIELGAERAEAICNWLVEQGGVSISRLRVTEARRAGGSGSAAVRAAAADQGSSSGGGGSSSSGGGDESGTWHVRFHVIAEVKISDRLEFDGGSDELRDDSKETLRAVAKILQTRRDVPRLTVEGHTCSDGPEHWNMQLSKQRAESVQRFLREDCGVGRERLAVTGFGPRRPLVDGHMNRRRNRRVEFLVM